MKGDYRSLCTVTFWQKTDLLISKPALVTLISTRDSTIVPNCASISKDVLSWSIFGNKPNNQSKLTGRVFIGCTARCPRMRFWPRLILLSWMVVSSTSLVRYGIVPLVWFSRFFPNFFFNQTGDLFLLYQKTILDFMLKVDCTKVLFIFRCSKIGKKSEGNHMLTNDCPHFFFANFTATKDEKYVL